MSGMKKTEKIQKKVNSYLYDHIWLKYLIDYGVTFFISVLSAAIFAFGVNCFLAPEIEGALTLVSGGSSGLAQTIDLVFKLFGVTIKGNSSLIFSIAYFLVNAPLLVLAFFGVGKRFGAFTIVNIVAGTIFFNVFKGDFFNQIATFVNAEGGLVARALFAGICTGLSSALAFKFETSAGGFDIVSYYLSYRKSTSTGKYGAIINACVITAFSILSGVQKGQAVIGGVTYEPYTVTIGVLLFSVIYLFTVMLLIDLINVRNKKVQVQINTVNKNLSDLLIANIPHGVTIMKGTGGFSGQERYILYIIISSVELNQTLRLIKKIDPNSFVSVMALQQVYGRFFQKPVR